MAEIRPIAYMHSDFPAKFGIPRQAGIVRELESLVVFEPEYRDAQALPLTTLFFAHRARWSKVKGFSVLSVVLLVKGQRFFRILC